MSYQWFIKEIKNRKNGKFEKFYCKIPGMFLNDGLRYIFDDNSVRDLVFHNLHNLHYGLSAMSGENFPKDEIGKSLSI